MSDVESYKKLCENELSIPLYGKDWWLDALCDCWPWDVLCIEENGSIIAAMPYKIITNRLRQKFISQPVLTQNNGLWIKDIKTDRYTKRFAYETELLQALVSKLEELNYAGYSQNFPVSFTNWLPFYWRGYKQSTRYTYVIPDLSNLDAVFRAFSEARQRRISKAEKSLTVKHDLSPDELYRLNAMSFLRSVGSVQNSAQHIAAMVDACYSRDRGKSFYAVDAWGRVHSAIFVAWDDMSAYYILGGSDTDLRWSDANSLLLWHAIQFSSHVTRRFDFEGSVEENIERFFRSFGAKQIPYFSISKCHSKLYRHLCALSSRMTEPWFVC